MAIDEKRSLRERLENCVVYEQVMPAMSESAAVLASLHSVAGELRRGDLGAAESVAYESARRALRDDLIVESAMAELVESDLVTEQIAEFAEAGFNFVRVSKKFRSMSEEERTAAGAAGSVTRVMRLDDTLLLETERISVRLYDNESDAALKDFARRHGLLVLRRSGLSGAAQFLVQGQYATYKCLELLDDRAVVYAEPDYVERIGQRYVPTVPEFSAQWHHAVIDSASAWDITQGAPVKVAFIDSGFHAAHPDLKLNPQLSAWYRSTPGGDDADFVRGTAGMPVSDHGTACAAMVASPENGLGGIGVAFAADLRVIACLSNHVIGTQATLARALTYAVDPSLEDPSLSAADGVDVIGCSLGPSSSARWQMRRILEEALDDVASYGRNGLGTSVLWACTNGNHPIRFDEVCSHPEVIAVGRSTRDDRDNGSGYGPKLEFLAPGVDVRLPDGNGRYGSITGTSFACPCATGVAALLMSQDASLSAHDVRDRMRAGCDKIGAEPYTNGRNDRFGYGRVNARNVV
ncbi:S8 family peptidase [Lentisalinibacter salinarum]|uniref:S8 family peptidase n=1 Tax=Lentisalinibacter salinarum TaxID=2992239 RepID=UPI0038638908